jgi:hypothetical protein
VPSSRSGPPAAELADAASPPVAGARVASAGAAGARLAACVRSLLLAALLALASGVLSYYGAFPAREQSLRGGYSQIEFSYSDEEPERYAQLLRDWKL